MSTAALDNFDLAPFATGTPLPSPAAEAVAHKIDRTLCETGFLLVTGHGIDDDVRNAYFDAMHRFFDLPLDDKNEIAIGKSAFHRGYVGFATETLEGALGGDEDAVGDALAGDMKETLDTGLEHGPDHPEVIAGTPLHGPNQWPALEGFREAVEEYRAAVIESAKRVQRALAMALHLDPEFFVDQPGETMYHLRLIHYPPMDRLTPEPGQLGCGAHTDYGTVTLLADDGVGGLQVRERSGEWVDVTVPAGHLVVNLGDLMAIWTNDRWVSNPHRVVNPPGVNRYSSPLFVTPPFHLRIDTLDTCLAEGETPRHEPMITGPYLMSRFDGTHSYRNELLDEHNAGFSA
ncbi:MAG: isopenicillin N synthase family oxygenase [Ilumatobacteraceae bacterium]|nr:isopenicillin N synthase family oxygenase [Ilumatobacteraceae bacterium]